MIGFAFGRIAAFIIIPLLIPLTFGLVKYMRTKDRTTARKAALARLPLLLAFGYFILTIIGQVVA